MPNRSAILSSVAGSTFTWRIRCLAFLFTQTIDIGRLPVTASGLLVRTDRQLAKLVLGVFYLMLYRLQCQRPTGLAIENASRGCAVRRPAYLARIVEQALCGL